MAFRLLMAKHRLRVRVTEGRSLQIDGRIRYEQTISVTYIRSFVHSAA